MANGYKFTNEGVEVLMERLSSNTPTRRNPTGMVLGEGMTTPTTTNTMLSMLLDPMNTEVFDNCDSTTGWSVVSGSIITNTTTKIEGKARAWQK